MRLLPHATCLLAAAALASCDGTEPPVPPAPVTFGGVAVESVGGATLTVRGTELVVSNLPAGADGGFAVDGPTQSVDVTIDPVTLPNAGRFGTRVEAAGGGEIAAMFAEGRGGNAFVLNFSFGAASGVDAVRIDFNRDGVTLFTVPNLPVTVNRGVAVQVQQSAGTGSGDAGSAHAFRRGGRWVVVSDSEGGGNRPAGVAGGCDGFLVVPPLFAGVPPDGPLCVDRVEVIPLTGTPPVDERTVVFSRGLAEFTVRTLGVQ